MTGRNSAVSWTSPPKPPSKSRRNASHPTTRKRPRETLRPFAPHTLAFCVSGWRRCVRRRANARKYRDNSGDHKNRKYAAVSGGFVADETVSGELVSPCYSLFSPVMFGKTANFPFLWIDLRSTFFQVLSSIPFVMVFPFDTGAAIISPQNRDIFSMFQGRST
jgi:hypothetical protein